MPAYNKILIDGFHDYFDVGVAATPELKQKVFKLRYRVYCDEFEYEPADQFADKQEKDQYDAGALNCLITHKKSGMSAACVRTIPADELPLPFETLGEDFLDRSFFEKLIAPRNTICEVSRLAVDGAFRRRSGEKATRFGEIDALDLEQAEKRTFGLLAVAAFLAATAITDITGRTNVFAMMEPFLPRILSKSGIHFDRVGENIDYHGIRAPYFTRTEIALAGMLPDLKSFYESIHETLKTDKFSN